MTYTPILGGQLNCQFERQFKHRTISTISLACTLVEQLSNDGKESVISHGSGFFWRNNSDVYLLTARHVLSGRSPFDEELLSKKGYYPKRIAVSQTQEIMSGRYNRIRTFIDLYDEGPNWIQDPDFDTLRTDIAAIRVQSELPEKVVCLNDDCQFLEDVFTSIGSECVVVGYPSVNFGDMLTPIWRKGSIASEPYLPIDSKPMFLLDAATSPGLSGSPVFRQHFGPLPVIGEDGSVSILANNAIKIGLVGVYAGRLENTHVTGEVPFVFYANRIPHLFKPEAKGRKWPTDALKLDAI